MTEFLRKAWYLTGPTAAGKTAVGLKLAQLINAEIISLDSMALYHGMDIGTAKPSLEERRAVPHHLIDVIEPVHEFSVAQYLAAAEKVANEITARGKKILFVGGTALYLKALLRGLFSGPSADWKLRQELDEVAQVDGSEALHRRLQQVDSTAAAKLHPNDVRRIIRALEVHSTTGQPISKMQNQFDLGRPADECRVFVLDWSREQLEQRIRQRVDAMFAAGLVDEVQRLLVRERMEDRNPHINLRTKALSRTAGQAVGYKEVLEFLNGDRDLPATIELVKLRTRQFAKRQLTWFRSLSECRWIEVGENFQPEEIARRIAAIGLA
ncbi:MAG TPA: tRNA (adenosine(37)-N6)-dimethylallyltransferase MiaA [Pirellulales bacterium]|jgi:tRNA dimethylallyltransferase|nr:tRNA (adenosine(37)-N6)-dimethylallyltransferase MiaA [Pirellulales bacterium]